MSATPEDQTAAIGTAATVSINLSNADGSADPGQPVTISITGGNASTPGLCAPVTCVSDSAGHLSYTYSGAAIGHDTINATSPGAPPAQAAVEWVHSSDGYRYAALGNS